MRRLAALAVVCLLVGAVAEAQQVNTRLHVSVQTCDTSVRTLTPANPSRSILTLQNVGTIHVGVSGSDATNVTLATRGFWTIHALTGLEFRNFTGGLTCTAAGPVDIQVIQELP